MPSPETSKPGRGWASWFLHQASQFEPKDVKPNPYKGPAIGSGSARLQGFYTKSSEPKPRTVEPNPETLKPKPIWYHCEIGPTGHGGLKRSKGAKVP